MTLDKNNKKENFKRALNIALSFALSIVFLYIAFYNVNFGDVLTIISHSSIPYILLYIFIFFLGHYLRAVRWKVILHSVKREASVKNLFGALMVGYGVNCVLPRFGEVSRAVLVGRWEGLSRSSMFGTVILERIIDIIFLAISVVIAVIIWSTDLSKNFPWITTTLYITFFLIIGILFFLILAAKFREKFYTLIMKAVGIISPRLAEKVAGIFALFTEGFASLKGIKNYSLTILLSAVIMLCYATGSYVGFYTIGLQDIQPITFRMAWVLMSISAIGVVIPTPGGTGSYHTITKSVLVLLFGFSGTTGLAYAFLTHIIQYFLFILLALIIFFMLNKKHEKLINIVEPGLDEL